MSLDLISRKIAIYCVAAVILMGVGVYLFWDMKKGKDEDFPTACTLDAKQCPDGSYVGRQGPNCDFSPCPTADLPKDEPKDEQKDETKNRSGDCLAFDVSLSDEFTLLECQTAVVDETDLSITITRFYNSPCPADVECIWSGVGIGFEYQFQGETKSGIDLTQAFGFQTRVIETDNETFANLVIEMLE